MDTIAGSTLDRPRHRLLRSYVLEAKYEFLRLLRTPMFSLPTLLFPAMFYLLFGVLLNRGNPAAATYLFATYGVFGVMGAALFGFGVTVAMDREQGFLMLKRALPMPPGSYVAAKMVMAVMFGVFVALLLALLGAWAGGVSLRSSQWALLLLVHVAGALPFSAIGLYLGTLASGSAAPAVVNLVYLPLSLLSGLWLPLEMLPGVFGTLAPLWPPYHAGQLALKVVGMDAGQPVWLHVGMLALVTAGFFLLARTRLAR